jgi:hypothetical protein
MCVSECISQSLIVHRNHCAQPIGCGVLLPCLWPEELAVLDSLQRRVIEVCRIEVNGVTPPVQLLAATRVDNSEEDDDARNGDTEIESERKDVVVSHPPHEAVTTEVELEDESDQSRRREVDASARGHAGRTDPEDGDVDVAEERSWVLASEEVEGDGGNGANKQKPNSGVVPARKFS